MSTRSTIMLFEKGNETVHLYEEYTGEVYLEASNDYRYITIVIPKELVGLFTTMIEMATMESEL